MKKLKSFISIFLILLTFIPTSNITCYANQNDDSEYYAQYTGSTDASWGYKPYCTFTVTKIVNNKFIGRFSATNLGQYSFDKAVNGSVTFGKNSFTCSFTVKFYNDRYYSNITATVDKINGTCECFCEGSWHLEDFIMTGTKFNYPAGFGVDSQFTSFSENDMKICMSLSASIYGNKSVKSSNPEYSEKIKTFFKNDCKNNGLNYDNELILYNTLDSNKDNAAFALTNRVNKDGSIDMFVVIRGTLKDEWQGNTEITGTSYDDSIIVHDNFNKGKDSIKTAIEIYYAKLLEKSSNINLIITGHSRGAAVANLYAKEATDAQNTTIDCGIPKFDNITAYTFACPNVEKYNSNIFNTTSNLQNLYKTTIERNMRAAEYFTEYVNISRFAQEYSIGSQVGMNVSIESLSKSRLNWFMAVNGFVYKTQGNVVKSGDQYNMNLKIEVCDYYDWAAADEDPMEFPLFLDTTSLGTGQVVILETINETTLHDMNKAGIGKNFESYGSFIVNVSWTKNQNYKEAVITT